MGSTFMQRAIENLIFLERGPVPDNPSRKKFILAPVALVSVDGAQYLSTQGGPFGAYGEKVPYVGTTDVKDEDWFLGGHQAPFNLSNEILIKGEHEFGDWKGNDGIFGMHKIGLI